VKLIPWTLIIVICLCMLLFMIDSAYCFVFDKGYTSGYNDAERSLRKAWVIYYTGVK